MIKYLKHNEIDKNKWDECIKKSINGTICAYSWYLDIICERWEALIDGDYESVFPLIAGKKYGISYLYQPFFTQQLGIFSLNSISEDIVKQFVFSIPPKYKLIEISLNTSNTISHTNYTIKKNMTVELDLSKSYEQIKKNYSRSAVRNIEKAIKHNVRINKNTPPEEIIGLFRNNKGKSLRYKNKHYMILKNIIYQCIHKGKGQSWAVFTKENALCAGGFFIESNNKVIFLFLATNESAKSLGATSYLFDRIIEENSRRNSIFDFAGSNIPGIAFFLKSFGSKERTYLNIRKNNLPWFIKWVKS